MNAKIFYGIITILVVGTVGYVGLIQKSKPKEAILGVQYADLGTKHVPDGTKVEYNSSPPSSGHHYQAPELKGFYDREMTDGNLVHNLEHGYVWIAYRPDLPPDQVQKLKGLFSKPFSNPKFTPSKAIVTKRSNNPAPISIVAWRWTMNFEDYDEDKLIKFYLQHVSKSPEAAAS